MRRRILSLVTAVALVAGSGGAVAATPAPEPGSVLSVLPGFDRLKASTTPVALNPAPRDLAVTVPVDGRDESLQEFLNKTAQGFVVLDGDRIVKEWYAPGYSQSTEFQSWSMAKSFTSDAVGIALAEGKIRSLDDTVEAYLPELSKSGYAGVSLRNLLRMTSGIAWNESSDDVPLHVSVSMGWFSTLQFASVRKRAEEPGTRYNYSSMNSAVLALVVARATGVPFHRYVQDRIWTPAGMASTAYVGNDSHGNGLGYCCIYARARDFARFGKMMLDGGSVAGRQVVPASWVTEATTPSPVNARYGLHWWLDGPDAFYASGLGGQLIYVDRKNHVVIVRTTLYNLDDDETMPMFRAVAAEVARTR
ncbi:serine hydrolase [Actinocorallia longicatena]